jgi:hypothetical protein
LFDGGLVGRKRPCPEPIEIVTELAQPGRINLIDPPSTGRPIGHEARVLQHLEVLGHGGPADRELPSELPDRPWTLREELEDRTPHRFAESVKRFDLGGGHVTMVSDDLPSVNPSRPRNAPTRIRTWGLLLRRESLYPTELSGPGRRIGLYPAVSAARCPRTSAAAESASGSILPITAFCAAGVAIIPRCMESDYFREILRGRCRSEHLLQDERGRRWAFPTGSSTGSAFIPGRT